MKTVSPDIEIHEVPKGDLLSVRELALKIFPVTYASIVEAAQIDYMMDLFYTPGALAAQHEAGQIFLIIYFKETAAGYASYTPLNTLGDFKLNKIYVDFHVQGKGLGKILLKNVLSRVASSGGRTVQLNVNRNNTAVGFYQNMGFSIMMEELLDIGNGYYMDDYVMEIKIQE